MNLTRRSKPEITEEKLLYQSGSDKRELLKDVAALANSQGGHLVLGVKETEGVATNVIGVDVDSDAEILRMEQIIRNAIDPPISGVRIRAIHLSDGNKVFLLRIPKSWNPPHRVTSHSQIWCLAVSFKRRPDRPLLPRFHL